MPFISLAEALDPSKPPEVSISDVQTQGCSIGIDVKENSYVITSIDVSKCQSSVSSSKEELKVKLDYKVSNKRLVLNYIEVTNNVIAKPYIVVKDVSGNVIYAERLKFDEKGRAEINKSIQALPGKQLFIGLAGEIVQGGLNKSIEVIIASVKFTYDYEIKVGPYKVSVKDGKVKIGKSDEFVVGGAMLSVGPSSLPIEVSYKTKTSDVENVGYIAPGSTVNVPSLSLKTEEDLELDSAVATPFIANDEPRIGSPLGIVQSPKVLSLEVVGNSPTGKKPKSVKFDLGGSSISDLLTSSIGPTDEFLVYASLVADKSRIRFIPFGSVLQSLLDIMPAKVFMTPEEGTIMRISEIRTKLLGQSTKSLPVMVYYDYTFGSREVEELKPIFVGAVGTKEPKIVPVKTEFVIDASYGGPSDEAKLFAIKPSSQIKSVKVYFAVVFKRDGKIVTRVVEAKTLGDLEKAGIAVDKNYSSKQLFAVKNGVIEVVYPIVVTSGNMTNVVALAFPTAVVVEDEKGQTTPYVIEFRDMFKFSNGVLVLNKNITLNIDPLVLGSMEFVVVRKGNVLYNPKQFNAGDMVYVFSEVPVGVGPFFILSDGTVKHFSEVSPGDVAPPLYEFKVGDGSGNEILVVGSSLKDVWSHVLKFIEAVRPPKVVVEKRGVFSTHINYPTVDAWQVELEMSLPRLELQQTGPASPTAIYVDGNGYNGSYVIEVDSMLTDPKGSPCAKSSYEDSITGGKQVVVSINQLIGNMSINQNCGVPVLDGFKVRLYIIDKDGNKVLADKSLDVAFLTPAPTCKIGEPITIGSQVQGSTLVRAVDCTQGQSTELEIVVSPPQALITNQTVSLTSGSFAKVYRLTVSGTKLKLEEYQANGSSFTIVKPGLYIMIYEFVPYGIEKVLRGVLVVKATGYRVVEEGDGILAEVAGTTSAGVEIDSGSLVSGVAPIYRTCCSVSVGGSNILSYAVCECPVEIARVRVYKDGIEVEGVEVAREDVEGKIVATGVSASMVASILLGGII